MSMMLVRTRRKCLFQPASGAAEAERPAGLVAAVVVTDVVVVNVDVVATTAAVASLLFLLSSSRLLVTRGVR